MKKTKGLSALTTAFFLFTLPAFAEETPPESLTAFDGFVESVRDENNIPGLSVAIIRGGETVHAKGYGLADVHAGRPMSADTPINIASISKPILGILLLQLRDRGLVDLDTDINAYLPIKIDNPHVTGEVITLRHLVTHTSGIADYYDEADYTPGADSPLALNDYLSLFLVPRGPRYDGGAHYLDAAPGTVRQYSNPGAGVAGAVAESVGHAPLAALAYEGIFTPLEMKNTAWRIADFAPNQLSKGYQEADGTLEAHPPYGNPNYPDGGVFSSARDMARLMEVLLDGGRYAGGALLSADSFADMFRLQLSADISKGQRFFWRDRDGLTGHMGSDTGVFTAFYFDRESRHGLIILMNRSADKATGAAMKQIWDEIRAHYF